MHLFLLLLSVAPAHAACTNTAAGVWRCADTGDSLQNGRNLSELLGYYSRGAYACGDTIILDAGASYEDVVDISGTDYIRPFRLWAQSGCAGGKRTRIVSSKLGELPAGRKVTAGDVAKMPRLVARDSSGAIVFQEYGVNNYLFQGVAITTGTNIKAANSYAGYLITYAFDLNRSSKLRDWPVNIEMDRCIVAPHEEITYGTIKDWYATSADTNTWETHFRSAGISWDIEGRNISVHESYFGGFTGFDPRSTFAPEVTFSSCTNASPSICTSTGIAAALHITSQAACSGGLSYACYNTGISGDEGYGGGAVMVVIKGATGNWAGVGGLNGMKIALYQSADTVAIYEAYMSQALLNPTAWSGVGRGSLTGTVQAKRGWVINPQYAVLSQGGAEDVRIVNNTLASWGMNVFLGGTTSNTDYRATIQAGSTWNSLILSNVAGLAVGDLVDYDAPGVANACAMLPAGVGCKDGVERVGRVTAINGTTVTLTGDSVGFNATDSSSVPTVGGTATWNGTPGRHIQVVGNTIQRDVGVFAGKGYVEIKSCAQCLIGGNQMTEVPDGNWFITTHQQGRAPWQTAAGTRFSDNLAAGAYGSPSAYVLNGQDSEGSSVFSADATYEHNVSPWVVTPSTPTYMMQSFGSSARYIHNTQLPMDSALDYRFVIGTDICTLNAGTYGYYTVEMRDNIVGYGIGAAGGANTCWSDYPTGINSNLFLSDRGVFIGTVLSAYPNNNAVSSKASIGFTGSCGTGANWENCTLSGSSAYRGTASDGGDPGADIQRVKDRINRWSLQAGLLAFDPAISQLALSHSWQRGSAQVAVSYQTFSALSGCTVELFTNRTRATRHADASSAQACNRSSSVVDGTRITYVFGAASALTASTTYFYRITDGSRVMVGEFTTAAVGSAALNVRTQLFEATAYDVIAEYSPNADLSSASTSAAVLFAGNKAEVVVGTAQGSVAYYRFKLRNGGGATLRATPIRALVAP